MSIIELIKNGLYGLKTIFEFVNTQPILQLIVYIPLGILILDIIWIIIKKIRK